MIWLTLIRIVIWATFFLLIIEGVVVVIYVPRFYALYLRKHRELEVRVETLERRQDITKEPPQ